MTAKDSKTFTFTQNGETHTIPTLAAMPVGAIRKARKAKDDTDQVFTILESTIGEDSPALAAIDTMDGEQFEAFMTGWTQGAPLGESSDS